jgi:hypothetical protein
VSSFGRNDVSWVWTKSNSHDVVVLTDYIPPIAKNAMDGAPVRLWLVENVHLWLVKNVRLWLVEKDVAAISCWCSGGAGA